MISTLHWLSPKNIENLIFCTFCTKQMNCCYFIFPQSLKLGIILLYCKWEDCKFLHLCCLQQRPPYPSFPPFSSLHHLFPCSTDLKVRGESNIQSHCSVRAAREGFSLQGVTSLWCMMYNQEHRHAYCREWTDRFMLKYKSEQLHFETQSCIVREWTVYLFVL